MKKIVSILLSLLALSAAAVPASAAASAPPDIDARSCILIHAGDGTVLYQHNADTRMRIASTTKIMVSFLDSLVAPLSLINAIIVAVGAKASSEEVSNTFKQLEKIWTEHEVYEPAQG